MRLDKPAALEAYLAGHDIDVPPGVGNVQVRCPFHDDSHPSASVNRDIGLFRCFTCAVSGDILTILQNQEGLSFRDAKRRAEELADSSGSALSRTGGRPESRLLPRGAGAAGRGSSPYLPPGLRR